MILANIAFASKSIINDIELFKTEYSHFYNYLDSNQLQPYQIIVCSDSIMKNDGSLEKLLLLYSNKLIILKKSIDGNISKHILEYDDMNYIIKEGVTNPSFISIRYNLNRGEKLFYESKSISLLEQLFNDLKGTSVTAEKTHFSVISNNEIIIFIEKCNSKRQRVISGELIYIPIKALQNISLEATERGMIMKYLFFSEKTIQLFYESDRTKELLKVMSFINRLIAK